MNDERKGLLHRGITSFKRRFQKHAIVISSELVEDQERQVVEPGVLLILTGPTAAGKTEVNLRILENDPTSKKLVTTTTRQPRSGERDGVDYHFLTREEFTAGFARGEFLESAEYGGNLYGTTKAELGAVLTGQNLVSTMEMSGALKVRDNIVKAFDQETAEKLLSRTIIVFIGVDSLMTLKQRFVDREGDALDRQALRRRLRADWEMWEQGREGFPDIVINRKGGINVTVEQVQQLRAQLLAARIMPEITV